MDKQKITIELTSEQLSNLEHLATIAHRSSEDYARDIVVVFLTQICQPISNLPQTQSNE